MKATNTKKARTFEVVDNVLRRRGKIAPIVPLLSSFCIYCKEPLLKSSGQIIYVHRRCRSDYRQALRMNEKYGLR